MCQKRHSKENLLRQCQQECKPTETRAKDEFEKKVECFNENWIVVEANQKPPNLPHEYKRKRRNQ